MYEKVKKRILDSLEMTEAELEKLKNADKSILIDPALLHDIDNLVDKLYEVKVHQETNPNDILIVDTDYDTDGVLSACVLTAALSVFNINHKIYVPSMDNGYGLSKIAVEEMIEQFETNDIKIHTILTADNGTNAIEGVDFAKEKGFQVLVTDHHLGSDEYAKADALVNPNTRDDTYPFKGNAGATVAWKVMQYYAKKYDNRRMPLIDNLIVFAGMANLSDVMPVTNENHYMIKVASEMIQELKEPFMLGAYKTKYPRYTLVFEALSEFIINCQEFRNEDKGKVSPYPDNEEFISWYISPMINAARRVESTAESAFYAFLHHDKNVRYEYTKKLYELNKEKTKMMNYALNQIDYSTFGKYSSTAVVNTNHGITGIVAAKISNETKNPTIIFVDNGESLIGSARSSSVPLPDIFNYIAEQSPGIILGGGGHANAAGYSIDRNKWDEFKKLFDIATKVIADKIQKEYEYLVETRQIKPKIQNVCLLTLEDFDDTIEYVNININNIKLDDIESTLRYINSLRPFGRDFEVEPKYILQIPIGELKNLDYNPEFWGGKTFNTKINGITVLTFNTKFAQWFKENENDDEVLNCSVKLNINSFMGRKTPQIIIN